MTEEEYSIAMDVLRCKNKVYEEIREMRSEHNSLAGRMDKMEANYSNITNVLKKHEIQRASFNEEMKTHIETLSSWFSNHDKKEMDKFDEIINVVRHLTTTIQTLTIETEANTSFIDKIKKYKYGLLMWVGGATALAISVWQILSWMQEKGMLIFFPST